MKSSIYLTKAVLVGENDKQTQIDITGWLL